MAKTSAAALRRRWSEAEALQALVAPVAAYLTEGRLPHTLDLRGAAIGMQPPLHDFRLFGKPYADLDLSDGRGALGIVGCTVTGLRASGFAFDRASHFGKAVIQGADFRRFKGRFDATDVTFVACKFGESTFRGGFNEYGFTRCLFEDCSLVRVSWTNTYFKACTFRTCDFTDAVFRRCHVAGLKFEGAVDWQSLLVECDIRSVFLNGDRVAGAA